MTTTTYSSDKDVNAQIASLVRAGWKYQARGRSKHAKVIAPNGRKMAVLAQRLAGAAQPAPRRRAAGSTAGGHGQTALTAEAMVPVVGGA